MRNQESTKKEAIHRKKIQAKNRSTIYKYPIISNKNEQPYKKKKLSPTTNQNPYLYHDSLVTKRKKNFKNCNKLPIKTETMQVHQTQEGNLSLLVSSRPVENDSLTAKTNKNQQQSKHRNQQKYKSCKILPDTRRRKIPPGRIVTQILSLQKETRISKSADSNYSKKLLCPWQPLEIPPLDHDSLATKSNKNLQRSRQAKPNQILQIVEKQKRKPLSGYEKGRLCPRRGPPLVRGWREENDDDGRGVAVVVGFSRRCPKNQK